MKSPNIAISTVNMDERKSLGIRAGDTVRVRQRVVDITEEKGQKKEKVRSQSFEGIVLSVKHGSEPGSTFTVRKVVDGVGVERIFTLYSPLIEKVDIVRRSRVRRAKLYHIREKAAKEIRKQMKNELRVIKEVPVAEPTETPAEKTPEAVTESK